MLKRAVPLPGLLLVLVLSTATVLGCAETRVIDGARELPAPLPDGVVRIPEASFPFVEIEEIGTARNAGVLRAPARVAFGDGAVSRLGAPLAGRVEIVHVRSGDRVQAGDPLVTLDCPEAASIRAALATAAASHREARAALDRQVRMVQQGVSTEREKLEAERSMAEAAAELASAEASVRFVGESEGTTVVLRAPIGGVVVSREATVGAAAQPGGEPLVEVGDPSQLWVVADVFERDLHLVHEGMTASLDLPSLREPLSGRVASIGAVVNGGARTAPVRISLEQKPEGLRPGMFGRARLESSEQGIAIPTEAVLIKDGRRSIVYVRTAPGTFSQREVVVSHPVEGMVYVASGLTPGEPVVVRGALLLDGAFDSLL